MAAESLDVPCIASDKRRPKLHLGSLQTRNKSGRNVGREGSGTDDTRKSDPAMRLVANANASLATLRELATDHADTTARFNAAPEPAR